MNFIKLNQSGKPVLVNLDNVTEIYNREIVGGCNIYFTAENKDNQVTISVDETLDQIYVLISQRTNNQEPDRSIEAPKLQYVRESYDPPIEKGYDAKQAYWSVEKEYGYRFLW